MPGWAKIFLQNGNSPNIEHILFFYDYSIITLILISLLVFYILILLSGSRMFNLYFTEGSFIETVWTIFPAILLIFLAFPSLTILYIIEDTKESGISIKVTGHQWYWRYDSSFLKEEEKERFIENSKIIRLLKTRENLDIPVLVVRRLLITSEDVIHSWAVPSLGIKVDALPGRLNQAFVLPKRIGLMMGQCSEICGANHSFIPVIVKRLTLNSFLKNSS